jgi:hypothetical protein
VQCLFHKCNVKGSEADDPFVKCWRIIMTHIKAWVVDGKYDKLHKINQYYVHNAWFEVFYDGCNKYGINSTACPVEALHVPWKMVSLNNLSRCCLWTTRINLIMDAWIC